MTGPAACFSTPLDAGRPSRFGSALAFSVAMHLSFVLALAPERPPRSTPGADPAPLSARLVAVSMATQNVPAAAETDEPAEPERTRLPAAPAGTAAADARPDEPAAAVSVPLPLIPDPTVYAARDLDSYPRPVAPLALGRLAHAGTDRPAIVRFEVTIDERGVASDVVLAGSGATETAEAGLRALLAATRFIPARKDGRAVKSRVLLSIRFAAEAGDR